MRLAEPVRVAEGEVAASGAVLARDFADHPLFTHSLSSSPATPDATHRIGSASMKSGRTVGSP